LPLGSISPYSKSSIDIQVFDWRFDDVPLIDDDHEVILKYAFLMLILYFWQMSRLQIQVMVLVMLAIYRLVFDRNPVLRDELPNCMVGVTSIQLLAVSWSCNEAELLVAVEEELVLW
jgi:hypothetical protein